MANDWASGEMAGVPLWDKRCNKSLGKAVDKLADNAGKSWSAALGPATRQAAGELCGDPEVTLPVLLRGHIIQTAARCAAHDLVLVDQDTTVVDYTTHLAATGLGPVNNNSHSRGYLLHSAFALSPAGLPLGLLGAQTWVRDPESYGQNQQRTRRRFTDKESHKWVAGLQAIEAALPATQRVLLIQDRESDVIDFLAAPRRENTHLLIRACQPRRVEVLDAAAENQTRKGTLFAVAQGAPTVATLTVTVPRKPGQRQRQAVLAVQCTPLQVLTPDNRPDLPQRRYALTVIRAAEREAPAGVTPLEWVLLTTMPLETAAEVAQMVRYYALRWRIERFHYTLKSGCKIERLQMDDAHSLMNALALYSVVAWRLMYLTYQARLDPEAPASPVFAADEVTVLAQATGQQISTLREAVRAVARLGGFVGSPSAGEPGLKSLWQGLRELDALVRGWRLALAALAKHQGDATQSIVCDYMTHD